MTPSEEIRATKELLMEQGWTQGVYVDEVNGHHCILGALNKVQTGNPYIAHELIEARRAITDTIIMRKDGKSIALFNDVAGRTFDEVCDLLDRAEKLAQVREETTA